MKFRIEAMPKHPLRITNVTAFISAELEIRHGLPFLPAFTTQRDYIKPSSIRFSVDSSPIGVVVLFDI